MDLEVTVRMDQGVGIVDVAGDVDLSTASRLEDALAQASVMTPPRVVVNLALTTYLDSTALRVLTMARRRLTERRGALAVACAPPRIARLFEITGLDHVVPLCATEPEACERVRGDAPERT